MHGMVKKLGVEHRSHRDGRARGPDWPDFTVHVQLRRVTNLPKRIVGQWMKHTISRLDAKHVEDAKVVLEYREAHLQRESQTDNQIRGSQ